MGFAGFGKGAQRFFGELAANNSRTWFQENQGRYERELLEPAVDFIDALGPLLARTYPSIHYGSQRYGSGSIMRIHRDVRFSPDKRPYKESLGIVFWLGSGRKVELPCFYLQLDARRAFFYGGQHVFPKPVLGRYRGAVGDEPAGTALVKILGALTRKGLRVLEEPTYKRVPPGFPKDHPRGDLLRLGGLGLSADVSRALLTGPGLLEFCADFAAKTRPLMRWLTALNGQPGEP